MIQDLLDGIKNTQECIDIPKLSINIGNISENEINALFHLGLLKIGRIEKHEYQVHLSLYHELSEKELLERIRHDLKAINAIKNKNVEEIFEMFAENKKKEIERLNEVMKNVFRTLKPR